MPHSALKQKEINMISHYKWVRPKKTCVLGVCDSMNQLCEGWDRKIRPEDHRLASSDDSEGPVFLSHRHDRLIINDLTQNYSFTV